MRLPIQLTFLPLMTAIFMVAIFTACSFFQATPSECVQAADEAGLPDELIEQLEDPDALNPVEQAVLQRALRQAGIDDLCDLAPTSAKDDDDSDDSQDANTSKQQDKNADQDAEPTKTPRPSSNPAGASASANSMFQDDENLRRCDFWALQNLTPQVYNRFTELDPQKMDDLDRILWRDALQIQISPRWDYEPDHKPVARLRMGNDNAELCIDYWAEPVSSANADLRNHHYEHACRNEIDQRIREQYRRMAEFANSAPDDDRDRYQRYPNQYTRILAWLDQPGTELVKDPDAPHRIFSREANRPYAYDDDPPTEDQIRNYRQQHRHPIDYDWIGILEAIGLNGSSSQLHACRDYFPQLFYGFWVPLDSENQSITQPADPPPTAYSPDIMPLYLPEVVIQPRVPIGLPLGIVNDEHHICNDWTNEESTGYHFVEHPTGSYCEPAP